MNHRTRDAAVPSEPLLTVKRAFDVPPAVVFDAWLDPVSVAKWLFRTPNGHMAHTAIDPRVDGTFTIVEQRGDAMAEHFGTYVELDRPRRIAFAFATDRQHAPTTVTVDIAPAPRGCNVTLTHHLSAEWAAYRDRARDGWTGILNGLAETLNASSGGEPHEPG
jgi:uncharacterized protein YndB with AHSA1/START domain